MMDTTKDNSLCGLIKFHSARLAEVAKDTEKLQATIDSQVAEAYKKGFEDGKAVDDKGCEGCKYSGTPQGDSPCFNCSNYYKNNWTAKDDEIEVGDEVKPSYSDIAGVVTLVDGDTIYVLWRDGSSTSIIKLKDLCKTGRHFDIASILEDMRND